MTYESRYKTNYHEVDKALRVCLVACINSEYLSPLIHAASTQAEFRIFCMFGKLGLLKQVVLRCCLVASLS
jgi:hypothetical protein